MTGRVRRKVLMIDIPTYEVKLPEPHKALLSKRLRAQVRLWENRTQLKMIKGGIPYSRGLLTLAACLCACDFQVKYLIHSDPVDRDKIPGLLQEADFVCINAMTPTVQIAVDLCRLAKTLNPAIMTVLGGPHIDSRAVETVQTYAAVDFAMIGEAEDRLLALLQTPDKPDSVGGLVYRSLTEKMSRTAAKIDPVVTSNLPMPAYDLLSRPLAQYSHHIKTYRGCPYQCYFCSDRHSWNSPHDSEHDLEQVVAELTYLAERLAPGTLMHFSDSILNLRWERTSEMLDRIKRRNLGLQFAFDTRVDLIKADQVKSLVDAGFIYFRMGFESLHNDVLHLAKKASTHEKEIEASQIIRAVSRQAAIHAYILTGLPGTTRESLSADVVNIFELVKQDIVDTVGNKIMVPYPGTPYGDSPHTHGVHLLHQDWSKYDRRSYPVFQLDDVSADEIYFGYLQQEAALAKAYTDKLGGVSVYDQTGTSGLGYVYQYYVDAVW
jgi:anaerobic magnesium-protoporphyrin IX monomethyl ester cyclase